MTTLPKFCFRQLTHWMRGWKRKRKQPDMTLLTVVKDVCAAVGVTLPGASVFSNISSNRTMQEMVSLANEMAQRIAYDNRDWTALRAFSASSSAIICLLGAALRPSAMYSIAAFFISRPPGPRFFNSAPSMSASCSTV